MKVKAYGYELTLKRFLKIFLTRLICTHKSAIFHACTGCERVGNGDNVNIGVSFVCDRCRRVWVGDIKACSPRGFYAEEVSETYEGEV